MNFNTDYAALLAFLFLMLAIAVGSAIVNGAGVSGPVAVQTTPAAVQECSAAVEQAYEAGEKKARSACPCMPVVSYEPPTGRMHSN